MANKAENLNRAKLQRDDEFYTPYKVVAAELDNYTTEFEGKRIICPCECPKELIEILTFNSITKVMNRGLLRTFGYIYDVNLGAGREDLEKVDTLTGNFIKYLLLNKDRLKFRSLAFSGMSDGEGLDFRSINYSDYDIAITNPPFTLMGDFVDIILNRFKKDLLILSSQVAITLKAISPHIISGRLHYAYTTKLGSLYYMKYGREVSSGELEGSTASCCGFITTLDTKQPEPQILAQKDITEYKKIGGALFVPKTKEIPDNYYGEMVVPITYIHKHNRDQFKILDILHGLTDVDGSELFQKLLIKRVIKQY